MATTYDYGNFAYSPGGVFGGGMAFQNPNFYNPLGAQSAAPPAVPPQPAGVNNAGVGATAPQPIQSFGALPYISPQYADPNQNAAYMQQYENLVSQALQPTFQQQQQQLQDQSAARGITGGVAQYFANDLAGQQAGVVADAEAPIVQQGYGYTQQDIQGNQAAGNNAAYTNAGIYGNALMYNANAYDTYMNTLLGLGGGENQTLLSAYLNSFGPNSGVTAGYGSALSGVGNTFGAVGAGAEQGQGAAVGGLFGGLGSAAGGGAFG